MSELGVDGWIVAEADLEHGYYPHARVARVFVFRNTIGWVTLTIDQTATQDDNGTPVTGRAAVSTHEYPTLDDLAATIEGRVAGGIESHPPATRPPDPCRIPERVRVIRPSEAS